MSKVFSAKPIQSGSTLLQDTLKQTFHRDYPTNRYYAVILNNTKYGGIV